MKAGASQAHAERRVRAARLWIEDYRDTNNAREEVATNGSVHLSALLVLVLTWETSDYLAANDPMALGQAQRAINGKSWLNFD